MLLPEKQPQRNPSLLDAGRSLLLIVDLQEGFRKAIPALEETAARAALPARAAARMGVPILVSEQYPARLGPTLPAIASLLPERTPVVEKLCFSACDEPAWARAVRDSRRDQLILCGVEAHVCILQTALDLMRDTGVAVYAVEDAMASRRDSDRRAALRRMEAHGVQRVTSEMVVFEWLRRAGTGEFREISGWMK